MYKKYCIGVLMCWLSASGYAEICPDPNKSSLRDGVIPPPWGVSPFSPQNPHGEKDTQFVRANILVLAGAGRGIVCAYKNSAGHYSIWQQKNVNVPAQADYVWRDTFWGYECTSTLEDCQFYD